MTATEDRGIMNLDEVDMILETDNQHTNDREHHSNEAVCSDADCSHTGDNECLGTDFDSDDYYEQSSQLREQGCRDILNSINIEESMQMVKSLLHVTSLLNEDDNSSLLTKVYHKCIKWEKEKLELNSIHRRLLKTISNLVPL